MATDKPVTLALRDGTPAAANDNAWRFGRPLVRALRRRADATYARSENVILPLRFAERMRRWTAPSHC
jgi:hypothetical protein